jgi:hypothetical protein
MPEVSKAKVHTVSRTPDHSTHRQVRRRQSSQVREALAVTDLTRNIRGDAQRQYHRQQTVRNRVPSIVHRSPTDPGLLNKTSVSGMISPRIFSTPALVASAPGDAKFIRRNVTL